MHIANGLYSKRWGYSCFFNNKITSCRNCLKKRLGKVIPDFKNAVNCKGTCRVCCDWWKDLSNKNCWFPKHKDYPIVKDKKMEIGENQYSHCP